MSAPSLAIAAFAAPGPGLASKRGSVAEDGDFAAALDLASAPEEVERPATPQRPDEAASAEATTEDATTDASIETVETVVAPPPTPLPVPVPIAPAASLSIGTEAEVGSATPAAAPTPSGEPDAPEPEPGPGSEPEADAAASFEDVASGRTAAATDGITTRTDSSKAQSPVPPVTAPEPKSAAPRTRDAIEDAQAGAADEADAGADGTAVDSASKDATPERTARSEGRASGTNPATLAQAGTRPAVEAASALTNAPDNLGPTLTAPVTSTEARPMESGVNLALSTVAHATIETTAQIAAQIVRKLEGRSTRFEMALTPEGLGQVDVSMDIDNDGKLVARLAFDNPLAATEMRGRVDDLRRQLQDAGFTVADDALSFTERDPTSQFFGQGGAFDRRPDPRGARAFGSASRVEAEADRAPVPPRWMSLSLTPDRVDLKV